MRERYVRAARLTAPKTAAGIVTGAAEGYWLDRGRFFFLAESLEPSSNRIVSIPSIADCATGRVTEVIPLAVLAELLGGESAETLSLAEFDMPGPDRLWISLRGLDYLLDLKFQSVREVRPSLQMPMLYSPDGRYACFVKGWDLWLKDRHSGEERPLTTDGAEHHAYGRASETELAAVTYGRSPKPVGLWSPDSQWVLTQHLDERCIPESALIQHVPPNGGRPVLHTFKYTMPGDPLPVATYVAFHLASGRRVDFDRLPVPISNRSPFGARRVWFRGKDAAWTVQLDRHHRRVDLVRLDLASGDSQIVLSETVLEGYIDISPGIFGTPNVRVLPDSNEIIWYSERDGWAHLYLHDAATGCLKNQITRGKWAVRDLVHVDEHRREILFLAGGIDPEMDPARRSLCRVSLDGSGFTVILSHEGDIFVPKTEPAGADQDRPFRASNASAGLSPEGEWAVVLYGSVDRGNRTEIVDLRVPREVGRGPSRGLVIAAAEPTIGEVRPRPFTALAADGVTRLHGVMFFPSDFAESGRYPLIDCIYPGPQRTQQPQTFASVMFSAQARALAELGFLTVAFDTRGMPIRDRAFHQVGYGHLLEPQLADHVAVVRQLCQQYAFIDAERVGIVGDSGGGAATARALFDYGDVFKVGVAACGNHDSSRYATIWSDKYRGPGSGDTAYAGQANSAVAGKLQGNLLLISGDMDENVHVSQTLTLVDALIRANMDFDLLIVPNAGHAVLVAHGYTQRRTWDYFTRHLLGKTPPQNFALDFQPHELTRFWKVVLRELRQ
jgi:dipeptidyl aminopeptidase/acylaminoacyl peptidase